MEIPSVNSAGPDLKSLTESALLERLAQRTGYTAFPNAYAEWKKASGLNLSDEQRREALQCIEGYASRDTDGDGTPDWGALVDGKLSLVLPPLDDDIDGDGVPNELDPAPFDPAVKGASRAGVVPEHLRLRRSDTAKLQADLYRDFHVLVIDGSDEHSPIILRGLLFLLRHGFSKPTATGAPTLRFIYASSEHDANFNIAAYHVEGNFISVGGLSTYPALRNEASPEFHPSIEILASLAHEFGHAYLFSRLQPIDLQKASEEFGAWGKVYGDAKPENFYARPFFIPYPESQESDSRKQRNLVSGYALAGVHEWFAEAFAGVVLNRIGMSGFLGAHWRPRLIWEPKRKGAFWANYNNVSQAFATWLKHHAL